MTHFVIRSRLNGIQYHHFMANDGETRETVTEFVFSGSQTNMDGDCNHELKRHLLLGRKNYEKPSVLQDRDITL